MVASVLLGEVGVGESAGAILVLGSGSEGALVEGVVLEGVTVSSFLLQAVNVKASTEAIIRVLLIILELLLENLCSAGQMPAFRLQETSDAMRVEIKEYASQQKQSTLSCTKSRGVSHCLSLWSVV